MNRLTLSSLLTVTLRRRKNKKKYSKKHKEHKKSGINAKSSDKVEDPQRAAVAACVLNSMNLLISKSKLLR